MTSHQITGDSAMANFGRRNYDGAWHGKNQVVIGIDIGTTQSGVAFTHLSKNAEIVHHRVTEWPGQDARSSAKIPSVIWYDRTGRATSFGAEALTLESEELAADRGWKLAQHFKLHLHPQDLRARYNLHLDPLPTGVPLSRIYTNFLNYLLVHTRFFFEKHVVGNAKDIWEKRRSDMIFVIAHPNGWQLKEQAFLRSAAVDAGFTTRDKAEDQIRFVTEAEASTHFCLHHTHLRSCLNPGTSFAVCDAGGSTVDTTLYITESVFPKLRLAEAKASECIQAGAMFVDKTAKGYLERLFEDANVPPGQVDEYLNEAIPHFELHGKRKFDNTGDTRVKVGTDRHSRDNPPIRRGQLKLSRSIVRSFFDPFVQDILASVDAQVSPNRVPHILLVGGFGENPYLYQQMKAWFEPMGCLITSTSNEPASKAVADGAVIWHCVNYVSKRTPHYAYGIEVALPFDRLNPDHQGRSQVELPSGIHVRGGWSQIVAQGIPVDCNEVTRQSYVMEYSHPHPDLSKVNVSIYRYKYGNISRWMTTKSGKLYAGFTRGCVVTGDLRGMRKTLKMYTAESGVVYWALVFHVCFRFGLTETKAFLEWVEEGVTKTGPATLVTEKVV